jgi:resuscitation-promoting factor RpfB
MASLVFGLIFSIRQAAAQESDLTGHLITIHDRGEEKVYLSDAETIAGALKDGGVAVEAKDAVEPALDEKLVAREYHVNIYRARPVTVIDGAMKQRIITPYQTAEQIAGDAGIALHDEDTMTLDRSDDIISDGAGLQVTIDRATAVILDLYGAKKEIRTQGDSVGELLKEKGIALQANDRSSVALETPVTAGMELRVWREGKQTVTVDEAVAFTTQRINDADRNVGFKEIQTAGQDGTRSVTYEIEIRDGVEVARQEIASITTKEPTKQIEVVGTKPVTLPYTGGGNKSEWLAASNIPEADWGYADFMVGRESGWNPNAVNKSSGACGLAQALPCSKVPGNPYDPIDSLNWMNGYVNGRYGGWANAYAFWQKNHWY